MNRYKHKKKIVYFWIFLGIKFLEKITFRVIKFTIVYYNK